MSDEKHKMHKHKGRQSVLPEYFLTTFIFVIIMLALSIAAISAAMEPVSEIVHKVENAASKYVRDVALTENNNDSVIDYGEHIADIACENTGLNFKVFYGANRVSFREGAGLSAEYALFGEGKTVVIAGYDKTYLSALKSTEKDDIITVAADDKIYEYKVTRVAVLDKSADLVRDESSDSLVIYSMFSDFSANSDKRFCVFADKINVREDSSDGR